MKRIRSFFYLVLAISLLFYGVPRFKLVGIQSMSDGFAIIWSAFAIVIIGAHLFEFLDVTRQREEKQHTRVREYRSS